MPKAGLIVYRNCSLGGVSSVILDRIALLHELGMEVHCLFEFDAGGRSTFEKAGATVHIFQSDFTSRLHRLISSNDFGLGVLFSHFHLTALLERQNIRCIADYHGSWLPDVEAMHKFPMPKHFVVPGDWSADFLASYRIAKRDDITVCPNSVRSKCALPARRSKKMRVYWVGRLGEEHKNWRDALSICSYVDRRIREAGGEVRFSFIFSFLRGNEHLLTFMHAANSVGLNDVELLYNLSPDVFDRIVSGWSGENSVFLSTSKGETFGLAAAQALVSGSPAVLSRGGAVEQVFGKFPFEVCRLFDRGRWLEASDAIVSLLQNGPAENAPFLKIRQHFASEAALGNERLLRIVRRLTTQEYA